MTDHSPNEDALSEAMTAWQFLLCAIGVAGVILVILVGLHPPPLFESAEVVHGEPPMWAQSPELMLFFAAVAFAAFAAAWRRGR